MEIIRSCSLSGLEATLHQLVPENAHDFSRAQPLYPRLIVDIDPVFRAGIIPNSNHFVRGMIRFPHSDVYDCISLPPVVGSACRAYPLNIPRWIRKAIGSVDVYPPWNDEVILVEEFALHEMYRGHGSRSPLS